MFFTIQLVSPYPVLSLCLMQVESVLATSNYVANIMVYANSFNSYCVALVVPVREELEKWAANAGVAYQAFEELCENEKAISEVQQSLLKVSPIL